MAKILIVDDRPDNRAFLVTLLGYAGYTLLEAEDAATGLNLVREHHPDLVITDILMPDVDGFEFVHRLRADPAIARTRVIFYSATYMETEMRKLAQAINVEHTIVKPAEPQEILATVRHALGAALPIAPPTPTGAFERDHLRLLLDKLTQKVDELETINAELEQRVAARTAELADANARLRDLSAFKDHLLAITSHDLRSPLGAIQNMAEILLEDDDLTAETRHRFTRNIYDSAQFLIDMVSKLLDLSRLESGKVQLELIELNVSQVARQALEGLATTARAKSIETRLALAPGEQPVQADWMKLLQILQNLIGNAIKFTPRGGQIAVTVAPEQHGTLVSVADTGLGIPAEALPELFQQFRQVHARGTADERGSGLGLAIVRQLVELHGGTIEVSSVPNQGSTFTVHFPAVVPAEPASE